MQRSYEFDSDTEYLNDRIDDKHCHVERRLLQARTIAASAIAASAQVRFVREAAVRRTFDQGLLRGQSVNSRRLH